jgi:hypothetical protein
VALGLSVAVFVYTFTIRTWDITRDFWMHYDQIRDWRIALGSLADAPLVGPATHVGGNTIGPAFYWVLWALRVTVGPWFDYLPHAGGIGQALLHSIADVLLFAGIRRRTGSPWLALAVVLLVASAPYDLALSRTIWNPMMAVTFAKAALALLLLGWAGGPLWRPAVTAAIAWAAVQAHFAGIFVALTVLIFLVADPLLSRQWRRAGQTAALVAAVVAAWQIPWFLYWTRQPVGTEGTPVGNSLWQIASGRAGPRLAFSASTFADGLAGIQVDPFQLPAAGWLVTIAAIVTIVQWRRDRTLVAAAIGPMAAVWIGFAVWQGGVHAYYYFSIMPAVVLTAALAVTTWRPGRVSRVGAMTVLAAAVALQPARVARAAEIHRMPEYGPLLRASRAIAARGQPMRRIEAAFVPKTSDPEFLYEVLGGRLAPDAEWIAMIDRDGAVRYERAPRAPSR